MELFRIILEMNRFHLFPCTHQLSKSGLGLCLLGAGIHPYPAVMVLALSIALLCKLRWTNRLLSTQLLLGWAVAYCASVVAVFALFGYVGTKTSLGGGGFGYYSADLLTLINPMGISRFLPTLPTSPGQYEGFGYVEGGVLVLSVIGIAIIWGNLGIIRGYLRQWGSLGACCLLFTAFAFSSTVTIAGKPILDLNILYRFVIEIVAPFRSSGRFVWPLHYLVITSALAVWIGHYQSSRCIMTVTLIAAVLIQLIDLNVPLLQWNSNDPPREHQYSLYMDGWQHADGVYKHMALYPPQIYSGGGKVISTIQEYTPDYYVPLAYQAYKLKLTFNSGYFARLDEKRALKYWNELNRKINDGEIEYNTIYVVHISYWDIFQRNASKIACGLVSEYIVCISEQRRDAFREFLISQGGPPF